MSDELQFGFLVIKFSSQLMQQRRCEEIPAHFIPKHHSKYLMRKSILNSKFQWLNKYISDEDQLNKNNCLSKFINIKPKQTFELKEKKKVQVQNKQNSLNFFQVKKESFAITKQNSHLAKTFSSNLSRKSRKRVQTDPQQTFCEEKDKPRNKSLLMNRTYHRKTPSFSDKDARKTFSEKSKLKQGNNSNNFRRNYEIENFALTPWATQKQKAESCEFITDF